MTPTRKYRLPIKHRHPNALRNAVWAIVIVLAARGLWYSITTAHTAYIRYVDADKLIAVAEADRDMALDILRGNRPAMTEDKLQFAKVTWEEVRLVEGLK